MFARLPLLLAGAVAMAPTAPIAAQSPPAAPPAPVAAPVLPFGQTFPPGAEVLSVDGEPLGRLAEVETRAGGERILHIRRSDGSMTTAPAIVASRGERAVVLEWTRTEFEAEAMTATAAPTGLPPASTLPRL
ncbi:MAG TPA: hypothetical protein VFF66_08435 [Brevundimonas sp.]|nr:hypothetical protein [Brevundimonas sp.]